MRRLDEWHKYVDLQSRRASAAKAASPSLPKTPDTEGEGKPDSEADIISEPLADGRYAGADEAAFESLPEEPERAYMRPTPLPPQIEFAPDDSHARVRVTEATTHYSVESSAPPASGLANGALHDGRQIARPGSKAVAPLRIARGGRSSARKETREELLARLLDPELTLEEAAQVLNVCPTTVRRYTNRGILPHYRTMGNQRRFRLSQVLAFLESQEGQPRPSSPRASSQEDEEQDAQQVLSEEESPAQS